MKPRRLYYDTYLQLLRNSVGTEMFRSFYVETPERGRFDALEDGASSCAFYVSAVLVMFGRIHAVHGTVQSLLQDMENSGWTVEHSIRPGDVILWEAQEFPDGTYEHIGFALGSGRAVSTSWTKQKVIEHDLYFGRRKRGINRIYRFGAWDGAPVA